MQDDYLLRKKLHMMLLFMFITVLFAMHNESYSNEPPISLREIIDTGRTAFRKNSLNGIDKPLHIQLEAKTYFSDGIVIENENFIISGV